MTCVSMLADLHVEKLRNLCAQSRDHGHGFFIAMIARSERLVPHPLHAARQRRTPTVRAPAAAMPVGAFASKPR